MQVTPFNSWKSGQPAKFDLTTGSQIPASPKSLTLFQTVIPYNGSQLYLLEAVWEPPSAWSGVPDTYRLQCNGDALDVQLTMPSTVNHKQINLDSQPPSGIQCSIVANNDVGSSEPTKSGSAQPGPPRIVSLHNEGKRLKIQYLNAGTALQMELSIDPLTRIAEMDEPELRQRSLNRMLFGTGDDGNLYALEPNGLSFEALTDSKVAVGSLAVDWIGRRVFYSVAEKLYVHELDHDRSFKLESQADSQISEMVFDPIQSRLYFTQQSNRAPSSYELRAIKVDSQTLETTPVGDQPLCGSLTSGAIYLNYSQNLIGRVVVVNAKGLSTWDDTQCAARLDFNQMTAIEQILIDVPHLIARNANQSILVYSKSNNAWKEIDQKATYMAVNPIVQVWPGKQADCDHSFRLSNQNSADVSCQTLYPDLYSTYILYIYIYLLVYTVHVCCPSCPALL